MHRAGKTRHHHSSRAEPYGYYMSVCGDQGEDAFLKRAGKAEYGPVKDANGNDIES